MELTPSELWSRVLESMRPGMPEQSFRTWLAGSEAVGLSGEELLVEAPSDFHVEWIEDKYGPALREAVERTLGRSLHLTFRTREASSDPVIPSVEVQPPRPARSPAGGGSPRAASARPGILANLNDRYTFDRFVVGTNNQLAAAASHAVAEKPARVYNPLFLYGGVGLGKTHLMHAVGQAILLREPSKQVCYVSTESFMNELVNAIQTGTTPDFRRRFRQIDLLLIDDIHFLQRKEGTQEEFFHTFNALYDAGKQIILTSDRPPKELPKVEDRLVSRFEWGLVVDIKRPDYETRVAILRKKATDDNLVLDDDVMDFIATSCTASVRELEGAVIKLLAYSSLRREDISLELARTALKGMIRGGGERGEGGPSAQEIRDRVAGEWRVKSEALASKRRTRDLTVPRQVAMYLIKELLNEPLVRIGGTFGGRDHSTVIHSIRKVEERISSDDEFARRVNRLRHELGGGR
jgi:chromosomal replication initiator protein